MLIPNLNQFVHDTFKKLYNKSNPFEGKPGREEQLLICFIFPVYRHHRKILGFYGFHKILHIYNSFLSHSNCILVAMVMVH